MRLSLLLPLLVALGCGGHPATEPIPYRFRQSLLQADDAPEHDFAASRAKPGPRRKPERPDARPSTALGPGRRCLALRGRRFLGAREGATLAFVRACLGTALSPEMLLGRGVRLRRRAPRPGDLVLFHNTRDVNGNGKVDDPYTDAGVVTHVRGPKVRFVYLHPKSGQVVAGTLNLDQPHRRRFGGTTIENTYLRIKKLSDSAQTRYLAGQLLAGFADLSATHGRGL